MARQQPGDANPPGGGSYRRFFIPALLQLCFAESGESSGSEIATGNPLVDLLVAVQRGVLMAAGKMGEVRLVLGIVA